MRTIAAVQAWENFSAYYSKQLGEAIKDHYKLTVTYDRTKKFLNKYDIVWSFFPHFELPIRKTKLVKTFFEPHEVGWNRSKVNVACSKYTYTLLKQHTSKAMFAQFGVNTKHFPQQPFPKGKVKVGWAGQTNNPRKQFKQLNKAMRKLTNARFIPNRAMGKGGRTVGKYKDVPDVADYYSKIHIYVCGSASEGFGFPYLEAAASGRPIVTFPLGIAQELKDAGAGVVLVDTFEQMREEVDKLALDMDRIIKLGQQSRDVVLAHWTWDKQKDNWLKVFGGIK